MGLECTYLEKPLHIWGLAWGLKQGEHQFKDFSIRIAINASLNQVTQYSSHCLLE